MAPVQRRGLTAVARRRQEVGRPALVALRGAVQNPAPTVAYPDRDAVRTQLVTISAHRRIRRLRPAPITVAAQRNTTDNDHLRAGRIRAPARPRSLAGVRAHTLYLPTIIGWI